MFTGIIRRFSSLEQTEATTSGNSQDDALSVPQPHAPSDGVTDVYTPNRRPDTTSLTFQPPPLDPVVLLGYRDDTPLSARLLDSVIAEEIRIMIPDRLRIIENWKLVYSLNQDGASLATLYQKCREFHGKMAGFILVVRDIEGGTFGAYLSEYPHPAPTYFGNGECFLWRASLLSSAPRPRIGNDGTTSVFQAIDKVPKLSDDRNTSPISRTSTNSLVVRFKAFPYSGINEYFINCESRFLSIGAGDSHYGLWLDDALQRGNSSTSQTFGNEPLSEVGDKFDILGVELWVVGIS